jgi:hypothetical protein
MRSQFLFELCAIAVIVETSDSAQDPSNEWNLFRWRLAQTKTLIGQVRRDGKPYPADPDWHDRAFNTDLPAAKKADGMKESH